MVGWLSTAILAATTAAAQTVEAEWSRKPKHDVAIQVGALSPLVQYSPAGAWALSTVRSDSDTQPGMAIDAKWSAGSGSARAVVEYPGTDTTVHAAVANATSLYEMIEEARKTSFGSSYIKLAGWLAEIDQAASRFTPEEASLGPDGELLFQTSIKGPARGHTAGLRTRDGDDYRRNPLTFLSASLQVEIVAERCVLVPAASPPSGKRTVPNGRFHEDDRFNCDPANASEETFEVDEHGELPTPFNPDSSERLVAPAACAAAHRSGSEKRPPNPRESMDGATAELLLSELAKHRQVQDRDEDAGSIPLPALPPSYNPSWSASEPRPEGSAEGTSTTQSVTSVRGEKI
jgi:hypothetical protein